MMKTRHGVVHAAWAAVAALPLALGAHGCSGEEPEPREVIRPVRYTTVSVGGGARTRVFSGAARAGVESNLSFKVPGRIDRIDVRVGERVRAGRLIAALDRADYEIQVQDQEASRVKASSQARNAVASYDRTVALYENNSASRSDLDAARAEKESAEAQVVTIEKKLELARLQLDYTMLRAPVDGAIAEVPAEPSENVTAGQTIAVLTSGDRPEVEVTMPEVLIARVKEGDAVTVRFDAIAGETFAATVIEVGVMSGRFATTYPVKVQLDEAADRVRPGMAAEVEFTFRSPGSARQIVVPPVAVGEDREGRFVWVLEEASEGTAVCRRRTVEIGDITSNGLVVRRGLFDGEKIVVAGVTRISDGQRVRLGDEEL